MWYQIELHYISLLQAHCEISVGKLMKFLTASITCDEVKRNLYNWYSFSMRLFAPETGNNSSRFCNWRKKLISVLNYMRYTLVTIVAEFFSKFTFMCSKAFIITGLWTDWMDECRSANLTYRFNTISKFKGSPSKISVSCFIAIICKKFTTNNNYLNKKNI